jgi:hypothetical protein
MWAGTAALSGQTSHWRKYGPKISNSITPHKLLELFLVLSLQPSSRSACSHMRSAALIESTLASKKKRGCTMVTLAAEISIQSAGQMDALYDNSASAADAMQSAGQWLQNSCFRRSGQLARLLRDEGIIYNCYTRNGSALILEKQQSAGQLLLCC